MLIAAGAFLTDVERFPWKIQSGFCVVGATHKFKSLCFVCNPSFFSLPAAYRIFSRGVIFTSASVSLAPLSLRTNEGLLVVYHSTNQPANRSTLSASYNLELKMRRNTMTYWTTADFVNRETCSFIRLNDAFRKTLLQVARKKCRKLTDHGKNFYRAR